MIDKWPEIYANDPILTVQIWRGGGAIWGGILGGVAGGVIAAWRHKIPIRPIMDVGGLGLIFGQAIGRLANVVNGEHTRVASDLPWAFLYTNSTTLAARDAPRRYVRRPSAHLYELIADLLILALLIWAVKRWAAPAAYFSSIPSTIRCFGSWSPSCVRTSFTDIYPSPVDCGGGGLASAAALFLFWTGRLPTRTQHWARARGVDLAGPTGTS